MWQHWTNVVLGLLIVAVSFGGLAETPLARTLSVLGLVVSIVGIWGAVCYPHKEQSE